MLYELNGLDQFVSNAKKKFVMIFFPGIQNQCRGAAINRGASAHASAAHHLPQHGQGGRRRGRLRRGDLEVLHVRRAEPVRTEPEAARGDQAQGLRHLPPERRRRA